MLYFFYLPVIFMIIPERQKLTILSTLINLSKIKSSGSKCFLRTWIESSFQSIAHLQLQLLTAKQHGSVLSFSRISQTCFYSFELIT